MIVFERGNLLFVFNFHHHKSFPDYRIGSSIAGKYPFCVTIVKIKSIKNLRKRKGFLFPNGSLVAISDWGSGALSIKIGEVTWRVPRKEP